MDQPDPTRLSLAALLRSARAALGAAVRSALAAAGHEDLPGNGIFLLGSVARAGARGTPMAALVRELGVSKQAAGQLVDTLVARGYLRRDPNPGDRRRFDIRISERGLAAARVAGDAGRGMEAALAREAGPDAVAQARAALGTLAGLGPDAVGGGPPEPRLRNLAPVLPVADLGRALDFYCERLGFSVSFVHAGQYAGIAREGCILHLKCMPSRGDAAADADPGHLDGCFVVAGAATLAQRFAAAGVAVTEPRAMRYGTEFNIRDPDGNVLAFVEPA
jgi:DNA-binding MarR family transcriptional regulator/predicted enzyme related to lactoylglutathione lyase